MRNTRGILGLALSGAVFFGLAGAALAAPAVATANVNVRSGPSTGYDAVDVLRRGERVDVQGCEGGWCYVEKRGPDGWISWRYLGEVNRPSRPDVTFQFNFGTPPRYDRPGRHDNWPGRPGPSRPSHGGDNNWPDRPTPSRPSHGGDNNWPDRPTPSRPSHGGDNSGGHHNGPGNTNAGTGGAYANPAECKPGMPNFPFCW